LRVRRGALGPWSCFRRWLGAAGGHGRSSAVERGCGESKRSNRLSWEGRGAGLSTRLRSSSADPASPHRHNTYLGRQAATPACETRSPSPRGLETPGGRQTTAAARLQRRSGGATKALELGLANSTRPLRQRCPRTASGAPGAAGGTLGTAAPAGTAACPASGPQHAPARRFWDGNCRFRCVFASWPVRGQRPSDPAAAGRALWRRRAPQTAWAARYRHGSLPCGPLVPRRPAFRSRRPENRRGRVGLRGRIKPRNCPFPRSLCCKLGTRQLGTVGQANCLRASVVLSGARACSCFS